MDGLCGNGAVRVMSVPGCDWYVCGYTALVLPLPWGSLWFRRI